MVKLLGKILIYNLYYFLIKFDALFLLHMLMWFRKWAWQCRLRS
jgi:hypothetical protein